MPLSSLAPMAPLLVALAAVWFPGSRPGILPRLSEAAGLLALVLAAAGAVQLALQGPSQVAIGEGAWALALRLDPVGATMTVLVAFIGWVVLRYTRSYLDGEAREGLFHGRILLVLAAVLVLVQADSLPLFVACLLIIGAGLRHLLLFYPDRAPARRAARKFALVWGAGDAAVIGAGLCFYAAYGTTVISGIAAAAAAGPLPGLALAGTTLVVVAAFLKTAAFPLHGWLTEVMEAPTPVSALLHAGVINAGGILLIRLAEPVQANAGAMAVLVLLGGFTALFGAVVMLTQSAVKTQLAWSTVSQMGFLLLQCGLGLWALALLHIVAHSLYKAHAFLASGGAVQAVAKARRPGPVAAPGLGATLRAYGLALVLYGLVAAGFGLLFGPKPVPALALGTILIFGVAYLVAQGLADAAPSALTRRLALSSVLAAFGYFGFHGLAQALWGAALPAPPVPGPLEWAMIVVALGSFGLVAIAQTLLPLWAHHPAAAGLRVHLANGLYLNTVLDRMIGGFRALSKSA